MKLNNSYTRIATTIILSVISTGNMIAFAQLSVQGKNENGQSYQYFYWNYPSYSIIDSVQLCVDNISDFAVDTTEGIRVRETSLLEIGKSTSKFLHRQKFIADSLHRIGYGLARQTDHLFEDVAYPQTFFEAVFQNYPEGRLTCAGKIITQDLIYEEDMPTFDWSISDSTRTILGLTCFKATCRFRGRDWTVWFAPDIPAMTGPWKFSGLPGLILDAYDSRREYTFTAERMYRTKEPIILPTLEYLKTTRDKYYQAQKLMLTNYRQAASIYMASTRWQLVDDGKPSPTTAMKYDFIEKE